MFFIAFKHHSFALFRNWLKQGDLYYVEPEDLRRIILECGNSEDFIKRRLGAGYKYISELLDGKRIGGWSASHVEWGLLKETGKPHINVPWMPK